MPNEIDMTKDINLWRSEDGLTPQERKIIEKELGFFAQLTHWLPTTLFYPFTDTLQTQNAVNTF